MPEISRFYGIVISMFVKEHNPPHFHVKYEGYRACIDIKNGTITGNLPRRALRLVYEWLDMYQDELLDNWNRLQNGKDFKPIKPLE